MPSKRVLILLSLVALSWPLLAAADEPAGALLSEDDIVSVLGRKTTPNPPPGTCPGKINAVYCKEDDSGRLRDIAYFNTQTGLQLVGCASGDWTAGASQTLTLAETESIVEVQTCKANPRAKLTVTVITDSGREMTCGNSNPRPYRGRAASTGRGVGEDDADGTEVRTASTRQGGRRAGRGRQLLQPRGRYNSNANRCVANVAPKNSSSPVWPLAAFEAQCDRRLFIKSLDGFCWNNDSPPPPPPPPQPVIVDLGDGIPCPTTPQEVEELQEDLNIISSGLLEASNNAVTIQFDASDVADGECTTTSTPATAVRHLLQGGGNTTDTILATFVPGPGSTQAEATAYLQTIPDQGNGVRDVCDVQLNDQSICAPTQINSLLFSLAARMARRLLQSAAGYYGV